MKLSIKPSCQGHGRCYEIAPELFTDDERGYGVVISPDVPEAMTAPAQTAAGACPERAVLLSDA